jgi:hypothetical protein
MEDCLGLTTYRYGQVDKAEDVDAEGSLYEDCRAM